jgi:subtilase family serine protease
MSHESPPGRSRLHIAALLAAGVVGSLASIASSQPHSSALIVQKANDAVLARLAGNTPGGMLGQKDLGQAAGTLALPEMALVLRRSPAQEQALARLLAAQQDRASPSYHHWLSPDEFGASYGASAADLATLSAWLSSHGFSVKAPSHGRTVLRFAGTSAQVEAAFHTQIHYFQSAAGRHFANVSDPQIPAAFAPAISGITGLHDFHPAPQIRRLSAVARAALPQFNGASATAHAIGPTDFATIYNVLPLQAKGISGHGSTIAIAAASSINVPQANAFWAALGVGGSQTLSIVVPSGSSNPGETTNEDEDEAYLDVEVAGGVAPAASIILVPSTDALVSAAYAIDNNLAPIVNISFGSCEPNMSAGESQFVASMYQEAAAAGISVVVAAGDQGSAACDTKKTSGPAPATHGFAVNGLASTPYNTAVGGTDFNFLDNAPAQYWAGSNAAGTFASALSYMPETAWNDTCANPVVLPYAPQYPTSEALCNDPYFAFAVAVNGGGGGVSTLYAQPTWQAGIAGLPSTSGRVLPDVSFFAAEGLYSGVSWLICSYANTTCDPAGSAGAADGYELVGGTSAAAPGPAQPDAGQRREPGRAHGPDQSHPVPAGRQRVRQRRDAERLQLQQRQQRRRELHLSRHHGRG